MSGPTTVTLPTKESRETESVEQQCAPDAVSCEQIREQAYYKWEAAGCPCCDGVEFWLEAEAELIGQSEPEGETSKS